VIPTYSVIIQNQKTLESFAQYNPLFSNEIDSGRIGICKWVESGTTIDTALPELRNLTDDKKEWRAIIVRYVDENYMAAYSSDPCNPFDFDINRKGSDVIKETEIPLVRLAQMLGGLPPLVTQFEPQIIREESKLPRKIYVPIDETHRQKEYDKLVAKYHFDGKKPSAILLLTIRSKNAMEQDHRYKNFCHHESDSSEFWKRNQFPSICRFVAYDFENQGPFQRTADEFSFWYAVLLMALNDWDAGTLQAYRLYCVHIDMDNEGMEDAFQDLVNQLRDAKKSINNEIKKDLSRDLNEDGELPDYKMDVPVKSTVPKSSSLMLAHRLFPLLSQSIDHDLYTWYVKKKTAEKEIANAYKLSQRSLDIAADRVRPYKVYRAADVTGLSKYQTEDLRDELTEGYNEIVDVQTKLPDMDNDYTERAEYLIKKIQDNLFGRIMKTPAVRTIVIICVIAVICWLPAIFDFFVKGVGKAYVLICGISAAAALVIVGSLLIFAFQKMSLNHLVDEYNYLIASVFARLVDNTDSYSEYMSDVVSQSRGCSYLDICSRKKNILDSQHYLKYKHINAIDALLKRLKEWCIAYHLDVDFSTLRGDYHLQVDTTVAPAHTKMYCFDDSETYDLTVNNSGILIESPFPFSKHIDVIREELYDDKCN
jgi:Bacterial cell division membrane protein